MLDWVGELLILGCAVFLLANPCMVFQSVCLLCLCSLHMTNLCVCMMDVISEFNSEIEGPLAFCVLFYVLCVLEVVCMWGVI